MGLREKVTLVLIAVVFYKTICSLCTSQSLIENPFEKYMNKLKNAKSRFVSKYETEHNKKGQKFQDDIRRQNAFKKYSFPEFDYPAETLSKVDILGKISSIDVLSDSALLNELRKEKRRKRKNKQNEKMYSRDDLPAVTVSESFRNQEPTSMGLFPEVQYPLTASDTWMPSYWNPLPSNTEDTYIKSDDSIYQNKKQKKKTIQSFLKPSTIKLNEGIFKPKDETTKIDQVKNVINNIKKDKKLNKKVLSTKQGPTPVTTIEDYATMFQDQPDKLKYTNVQPKTLTHQKSTTKMQALEKIISEVQLASKKNSNSSKKVNSESMTSRSRLRQFPQSRNKISNICASDNTTTTCINSTKPSVKNVITIEDSAPNIQNIKLPNDVELSEAENMVSKSITYEDLIDKHPNKVPYTPIPSLIDKLPNSAVEDILSEDNLQNYLLSENISEVQSFNDLAIPTISTPKDELVENSTLIGKIVTDPTSNDTFYSTKLEIVLADTANEPLIESYPAYPTNLLTNLQSDEIFDYPISLNDDSMRQRILEVLSTEKLSVSSLRENILKILLTEEQNRSGIISESPLNDFTANEQSPEAPLTENLMSVDIFEIPLPVSPLIEDIDNPPNYVTNDSLFTSIPSIDILEFPTTVTTIDYLAANGLSNISKGVISEIAWNDNADLTKIMPHTISNEDLRKIYSEVIMISNDDIIPEETEKIPKDTFEVIYKSSEDLIEKVTEPIVSETLADNLREIISKPSNSRALVHDLREIIRLLTIWNSQIDDSDEIIKKTSEMDANAHNSAEFTHNPVSKITSDTAVIDIANDDVIELIREPKIDTTSNEKSIIIIPENNLLSENSVIVFSNTVAETVKNNEKLMTKSNKNILGLTLDDKDTPANEYSEAFKSVYKTLLENPSNGQITIITDPVTNEYDNINNSTTTDSSEIKLDSMHFINNITPAKKLEPYSSEIIPEFAANDDKDTLRENPDIDFSEIVSSAIGIMKHAEKSTIDFIETISGLPNNDTLPTEKMTVDSNATFSDLILNEFDNVIAKPTIESDEITSDPNNTMLTEKPTIDCSKIFGNVITNSCTILSQKRVSNLSEFILDLADNDNVVTASDSNKTVFDSITNDKGASAENPTFYSIDITHPDLYDFDRLAEKLMSNSSDIISERINDMNNTVVETPTTDSNESFPESTNNKTHYENRAEVISEPFTNKMFPDHSMKEISGYSLNNIVEVAPVSMSFGDKRIYNLTNGMITDFEIDTVLSDDLNEIISNYSFNDTTTAISSTEFPSTFTLGDIISSLNEEKRTDIPISFVSSYVPPFNDTLISIENEIEKHSSNPLAEISVLEDNKNLFENICPIIDDNSFKDQCCIFEEPNEFNSTSNITNILTGKMLLTSIDELLADASLNKTQQSDITLPDLIVGYKYFLNSTTTSQDIATSSNISDANELKTDGKIPDFLDISSPEDDTTSDLFENTLFNNTETHSDQFFHSLLLLNNATTNMNDKIETDIVSNECDKLSLPIKYMIYSKKTQVHQDTNVSNATVKAQGEYDTSCKSGISTEDSVLHETDIDISYESTVDTETKKFDAGTSHKFVEYVTVPDDEKTNKIVPDEFVIDTFEHNISDESAVETSSDRSAGNLVPDTAKPNGILTISQNKKTDQVLNMFNTTDMVQDESDTYIFNKSDLFIDGLLPFETVIGILSESKDDKTNISATGTSQKSVKHGADEFVADISNEFEDETELYKMDVGTSDQTIANKILNKLANSSTEITKDSEKDEIGTVFVISDAVDMVHVEPDTDTLVDAPYSLDEYGAFTDYPIPHVIGIFDETVDVLVPDESIADKSEKDEIDKVFNVHNAIDMIQDEFDTYTSNEYSGSSADDLIPHNIGIFDESVDYTVSPDEYFTDRSEKDKIDTVFNVSDTIDMVQDEPDNYTSNEYGTFTYADLTPYIIGISDESVDALVLDESVIEISYDSLEKIERYKSHVNTTNEPIPTYIDIKNYSEKISPKYDSYGEAEDLPNDIFSGDYDEVLTDEGLWSMKTKHLDDYDTNLLSEEYLTENVPDTSNRELVDK